MLTWDLQHNNVRNVMSLSVTAYPFPWGCGVLLLEPIPALSQGEGRVLPGQVASSSQGLTSEQRGVQYLAQGHLSEIATSGKHGTLLASEMLLLGHEVA